MPDTPISWDLDHDTFVMVFADLFGDDAVEAAWEDYQTAADDAICFDPDDEDMPDAMVRFEQRVAAAIGELDGDGRRQWLEGMTRRFTEVALEAIAFAEMVGGRHPEFKPELERQLDDLLPQLAAAFDHA